jgi:predicted ATPase/DNA-binding XRE family transcriptional regulator
VRRSHTGQSVADVTFGDLLRRHRVSAGLTQEELAEHAGLSLRGISDLERGMRRAPHRGTILRLAEALGLDAGETESLLTAARRARTAMDTRAPSPFGHHLPLAASSLVGRERDIAEVHGHLERARLVTLVGPGGIGKTRLALEVARGIASSGLEVALVEFAPVTDPELIYHRTAAVLGIEEQLGQPRLATLAEALRARQLLLVIDNCEHVITACAQLADALLGACAEVRILATSREALRVAGETIWPVPPLSVPDYRRPPTPGAVAQSEAGRLFVDRAHSALPAFNLTAANATAVARVCQHLEGMPLALELAAASVRHLSPDEIASRLHDALRLLVEGSRVAPARQQTLQATIDWSYALLDSPEQLLFEQLSVFAGGWTVAAAEAVCRAHGIATESVVNLLARLADKSLLGVDHRDDGPVRYHMLQILRQYGSHRLNHRTEAARIRRGHAEYFLEHIERAGPAFQPPHEAEWFTWIHQELDNLRAALDWAIESSEAGLGLRIASKMIEYWFHVHQTEGQSRLQRLLTLPNSAHDPAARGAALVALGRLTRERGDLARARAHGAEGLALARELGDRIGTYWASFTLSWTFAFQDDWETAESLLGECLHLGRGLGDLESGVALGRLGSFRALQHNDVEAYALLQDSVVTLRALGADLYCAGYLCNLADVALRHDQLAQAHRHALDALDLAHRLRYAWAWETRAIDLLVRLAAVEQQFERAVRLAGAVSSMHPELGKLLTRMASPKAVGLAERALGPGRSAAAWAEGQAMTREQALAFAQQN